jgi:hypothetical protein
VNPVLDRLHPADVSVTLRGGNNHETMLITVNTETFLAEAAALPCGQSFDSKRRPGHARALAGRCAR